MPERSLDSYLDIASDFPHALGSFAELRRYVRAVSDFLPHTSAQQAVRIEARLKIEIDPVRAGELEYDLEIIQTDSETVLPRIVWGGVLVTIFAAYENGVRNALVHWQITTMNVNIFKVLPRKDFILSAEKYSKENIGVDLFANESLRKNLFNLKAFRNSFAHGTGSILDFPDELNDAVCSKLHAGVRLDISDTDQWIANARCAAYYLLVAERAIKEFSQVVLDKIYDFHRSGSKHA